MRVLLGSLRRNRRLLKDFVARDLKARYVGSSMGFFWSVVFPIINLVVFMFVFRIVLKARWGDSQGPLEVALVMLAGIVVWAAFAETVSRSTNTLVENANLIQKVVFPSELLPVYLTVSSLINMCIGLPVVIGCTLWFAYFAPPEVHVRVPSGEVQELYERGDVVGGEQVWVGHQPHGAPRGDEILITIGLDRSWYRPVEVPFRLEGTATRGEDYVLDVDTVTIPAGDVKVQLVVTAVHDEQDDEGETIVLRLLDPAGARLIGEARDGLARRLEIVLHDTPAEADVHGPPPPNAVHAPVRYAAPPQKASQRHHPLQMGASLLFLPVLFLLQTLFTAGLGYFLATLNLFARDTYHLVGVAITVWMFATPIFYPEFLVVDAGYGLLPAVNPMHWLIDSYRGVLLYGLWPDPLTIGKLAAVALAAFVLGGAFFMSQKAKFPDLL